MAIKIIDPFTNIELKRIPTADDSNDPTFLSNLQAINVGQGGTNTFRADKSGIWLGAEKYADAPFRVSMAGGIFASDFTLVGGSIKYGKTSFTDNTHSGYYLGSEGIYAGKVSDDTIFKFKISDGTLQYGGKVVAGAGSDIPAGYITGSIVASQIGSVYASVISGLIQSTQIQSITAGQITGSITASQIASVYASAISGSITASQISSVYASVISGQITSSQIQSIAADKITGQLTAGQISSVYASAISGSITASQISSVNASAITGSITSSQIQSITAGQITGQITASQITDLTITADKIANLTITAGKIADSTITNAKIANLSADKLTAGTIYAGGTNHPEAIVIAQGTLSGSAKIYWTGGSRIWEDSSNRMGINSVGSPMYIYVDSEERIVIPSSGQTTIRDGVYSDGNLNVHNANLRIDSGYLWVNTSSSPSERLYVEGSGKFIGNLACNHIDPRAANSYNCGGASLYWAYVNTHDVTYHSIGFYDGGMTIIKNGKKVKVSDLEAILAMRPHKNLKTKDGVPLIDKTSVPVELFLPATDEKGKPYKRNKQNEPIVGEEARPDADGISGAQSLGLLFGAIKEMDDKIEKLKEKVNSINH